MSSKTYIPIQLRGPVSNGINAQLSRVLFISAENLKIYKILQFFD